MRGLRANAVAAGVSPAQPGESQPARLPLQEEPEFPQNSELNDGAGCGVVLILASALLGVITLIVGFSIIIVAEFAS